jgi:hypothetical protein
MDIFIKNGVIKEREEVQQNIHKLNYEKEYNNYKPGPYHDPKCLHLHVWKPVRLIKNFKGPQLQSSLEFKHHPSIPDKGIFCSICHVACVSPKYNLKHIVVPPAPFYKRKLDSVNDLTSDMGKCKIFKLDNKIRWDRLFFKLQKREIDKYKDVHNALNKILKHRNCVLNKWSRFVIKMISQDEVLYPINSFKSIIIKKQDMTPYQLFRYNNPEYKEEYSFYIAKKTIDSKYITIG